MDTKDKDKVITTQIVKLIKKSGKSLLKLADFISNLKLKAPQKRKRKIKKIRKKSGYQLYLQDQYQLLKTDFKESKIY